MFIPCQQELFFLTSYKTLRGTNVYRCQKWPPFSCISTQPLILFSTALLAQTLRANSGKLLLYYDVTTINLISSSLQVSFKRRRLVCKWDAYVVGSCRYLIANIFSSSICIALRQCSTASTLASIVANVTFGSAKLYSQLCLIKYSLIGCLKGVASIRGSLYFFSVACAFTQLCLIASLLINTLKHDWPSYLNF